MRLEKISENQIRCTLNKEDLAERELKISELAYGTEKAKDLFREMMQQASFEFGFEAEDIPLMIEAIPVTGDCIILIITKVDDPEELDTRFSKFSAPQDDDINEDSSDSEDDDIASLFSKIQEIRDSLELNEDDMNKVEEISVSNETTDDFIPFKDTLKSAIAKSSGTEVSEEAAPRRISRIFSFNSFEKVNTACQLAASAFNGASSLYKDTPNNMYYLVLTCESSQVDKFNRTCNAVSEFGTRVKATYATESYYKEHFDVIVKENAVPILGNL